MAARKESSKRSGSDKDSSANIAFEAKLWLAADKLLNNMNAAEYEHVALSLFDPLLTAYKTQHFQGKVRS